MRALVSAGPDQIRLTFMLSRTACAVAAQRLLSLLLEPCSVDLRYSPLVSIGAPNRELAFQQAHRLFQLRGADEPPASIDAMVSQRDGRVDRWTIIVGADVAFAPTALGAYLPALDLMAEPAKVINAS